MNVPNLCSKGQS